MSDDHESASEVFEKHIALRVRLLQINAEYGLDRTRDDLSLDAIDWVIRALETGQMTPNIVELLVSRLRELSPRQARKFLGVAESGRPNKKYNEERAKTVFELHQDEGEQVALIAAYNAFFHVEGRTYADDKEDKIVDARTGLPSTVADRSMDQIRAILRAAGLIGPRSAGRKQSTP